MSALPRDVFEERLQALQQAAAKIERNRILGVLRLMFGAVDYQAIVTALRESEVGPSAGQASSGSQTVAAAENSAEGRAAGGV